MYRHYTCARVSLIDTLVLVKVLFKSLRVGDVEENRCLHVQQAQFVDAGYNQCLITSYKPEA